MTWTARAARALSILSRSAERATDHCTLNGNELGGGPISAMVHPSPLYRIEGEPHRHAEASMTP